MTYWVVARWGDSEDVPNEQRMRELLAQLDKHDLEHPATWLTHESGWTLSVFESGLVIWENMEFPGDARHQVSVSREKGLSLWLKLSRGEIAAIEDEPWCAGQSPPQSAAERAELARNAAELTLASDRQFYEKLEQESPETPCSQAGCRRGSIRNSVFCRVHHFESVSHRPCPFDD